MPMPLGFNTENATSKYFSLLGNNFKLVGKYINTINKVKLKCVVHNKIFIDKSPAYCIKKGYIKGCRECVYNRLKNRKLPFNIKKINEAKEKFISLLSDKFDLIGDYYNTRTPVRLLCKVHNKEFNLIPKFSNMRGYISGCEVCVKEIMTRPRKTVKKESVEKRLLDIFKLNNKIKFCDKYSGYFNKMKFYCLTHKQYFYTNADVIFKDNYVSGCSKCKNVSLPERQILSFIEKLMGKNQVKHNIVIKDNQGVLKIDFVIPSLKIIIEHNGVYWHSAVTGSEKDDQWKNYKRKERLNSLGYRLIQIWEDNWTKQKPAIKRYLKAQLRPDKLPTWYARKLLIKHPSSILANKFINKYHPQGRTYGKHDWISLFDPETKRTVAVMGFSSNTRTVRNKLNTIELTRYASRGRVDGGASRLLVNYLRKNPHIKEVLSFSDNDLFEGKMYERIGFKYNGEVPPIYSTIWSGQRKHKSYTTRKNLNRLQEQKRIIFDPRWTEEDCLYFNGVRRCWNSGKKRWVYKC